jgi:hypothetical protein
VGANLLERSVISEAKPAEGKENIVIPAKAGIQRLISKIAGFRVSASLRPE